ncbi:MAG: hypothetical protein LRZ88_06170 [Candidatus Cloacimonetes bacterium]|nr:hypothetical protein [Candidatus Cloacimonadota bacterium]
MIKVIFSPVLSPNLVWIKVTILSTIRRMKIRLMAVNVSVKKHQSANEGQLQTAMRENA